MSGIASLRSKFLRDDRGVAAVELALLLPVAFFMLALAVFGGEGLGIQRKVTLAARTITDLVGQTSSTTAANSSGYATISTSTLSYYLSLSSLVVYPYDTSQLQAEVSEVNLPSSASSACSGSNPPASVSGTVVWSLGYNGGVARTTGSSVAVALSVACAGAPNLLLGETQYHYTPVGIANISGAFNITGQIFMIPRSASKICVDTSSC